MFRSKKEVDAHVRDVLAKCSSDKERLKLCLGIAKQYAGIKDFESAKRYLETHLLALPSSLAEPQKLLGDIYMQLGEEEKALECYKISYSDGQGRDTLNRVCDLLIRGYGAQETEDSRRLWLGLQKTSSLTNNQPLTMNNNSSSPGPGMPRKPQFLSGGPPKTGFSHTSFTNGGGSSTLVSSTAKTNGGGNFDLQLRYLERRFDDGLGKILDQNSMVLEQMLRLKDEIRDLSDKIEQVSSTQQQMQSDIKEIQEKEPMTVVAPPPPPQVNVPQGIALQRCGWYWNCSTCQMANDKDALNCITCAALRPIYPNLERAPPVPSVMVPTVQPTTFGFGIAIPPQPQQQQPQPVTPQSLAFGLGTMNISNTLASSQQTQPFTNPTSANENVTQRNKSDDVKDAPPVVIGSNKTDGLSFSDLAKGDATGFSFAKPNGNLPAFPGAGMPLFQSLNKNPVSASAAAAPQATIGTGLFSSTSLKGNDTPKESSGSQLKNNSFNTSIASSTVNADDEAEDDFVPTAEFQPVIPLPPLVETKKGDENENTIVEYRAKLYRFVTSVEPHEWKERGIGNIKLLQAKDDPRKCRVVMWREKIGKLACNFNLFPDIKITNYNSNPKVLCWKCQDFAEDDGSWESFTLKFGNEDNCAHFKKEMERLSKMCVSSSSPKREDVADSKKEPAQSTTSSAASTTTTATVPLSELFKKAEGSWSCGACYLSNGKGDVVCAACQTPKPGFENVDRKLDTSSSAVGAQPQQPTFSFGFPTAKQTTPPSFSFGFNNSTTTSTPTTGSEVVNSSSSSSAVDELATPKKSEEIKDSPFAGLNLTGKFSFADLAKNDSPGFSFGKGNGEQPTFAGAGSSLFSSLNAKSLNKSTTEEGSKTSTTLNTSTNAEDEADDFVPTAEFQPVIPLPPLVETKKGDENENTIVEYRAKLYRFVTSVEPHEWKERGIGNIKLLQAKDDPRKCRVVMWREKIGKLACNFNLFPDIKITNYNSNPKVLCWKCQDFAEDDGSWESFTLKFGNEDNCAHFKTEMERLSKLTISSGTPQKQHDVSIDSTDNNSSPSTASPPESAPSSSVPLSQLFKKAEGSWNCGACYLSNEKDVTVCPACQTVRPGYENKVNSNSQSTTEPPVATVQPTFSFGFPGTKLTTPPSLSFGKPNNNSSSSSVQSQQQFGANISDQTTPKKSDENKDSPFAGLNLSGKFSFGDLAKNNANFSFGKLNGETASFAGAGSPLFTSLTKKDNNDESKNSNANTSAADEDTVDDFVPTAEFQPVIPLPPLVETKKGDEDENTIVEYRAKIYRYISSPPEWKERGVGNIKLLQSKNDPKKCRVVMWREKIGKLACNFNLFPDIKVTNYQDNPKILSWKCQDFAEEPSWEMFTLRFGNEENCRNFKDKMLEYAAGTSAPIASSVITEGTEDEESTNCPGCIGCGPKSETFSFTSTQSKPLVEQTINIPLGDDSSFTGILPKVTISWFENSEENVGSSHVQAIKTEASSSLLKNTSLPSFSFSMPTQDNNPSSSVSFPQFNAPSFFKPSSDGSPATIFNNSSIFSPSSETVSSSANNTTSPFVSPFAKNSILSNSSFQSPTFKFSQQSPTQEDVTTTDEPQEEDEYEDVDDEDECMFEDDAHVYIKEIADSSEDFIDKGDGLVRVLYDGDSYCARLVIMVDDEVQSEHLVAVETVVKTIDERTCEWIGVTNENEEAPIKSRFKVTFSTDETCQHFKSVMSDGVDFAQQAGITENVLLDPGY